MMPSMIIMGICASRTSSATSINACPVVIKELLFRAALQPWIGIWLTSLLFGIAHSGTARLHEGVSAGKFAYLLFAIGAGVSLGLLYRSAGLVASMTAHAAYDIGTLFVLAPAIAAWRPAPDLAGD